MCFYRVQRGSLCTESKAGRIYDCQRLRSVKWVTRALIITLFKVGTVTGGRKRKVLMEAGVREGGLGEGKVKERGGGGG